MLRRLLPLCSLQLRQTSLLNTCTQRLLYTPSQYHGLWEPNDLKLEPDIPEFSALHIQMKGYDYAVLESYSKFIHNAMDSIFNLDTDSWASPAKKTEARTYHPRSTTVNEKYNLSKYDRTVLVENIPTIRVPILLQFIRRNSPPGVEVSFKEPSPDDEEFRYVPDYDVIQLKAEKEAIASGKLRKK
ncbi:39S ribosomal protein L48 mitochondrial isoform X2 [Biomphalaria glabrata]|uniref:Uncharacterized protein LOC106057008 n=1 Tax=Biomphalaria glabrata TaxID=6526 RepID=A0A9W2ZYU6_BIOGL|nr:uncharacterized protein LOC106057008 [Biomphalaria glabrata]KAI8744498.1 39S ribosomal protein L48, mitochondrial isoform X2 [Biomphalaria glabrata]KAI8747439.1 39S ribosomal protein L48; mitochondrial isoform X2 [Biomphalaria glabrata]